MARFHFDEPTGTLVIDSSGHGNVGTLTSDHVRCAPGVDGSGGALCLPGCNGSEYVEVPHDPSLNPQDTIYLSAYVIFEPICTYSAIICKGRTQISYSLLINPDGRLFFIGNYATGQPTVQAETDPGDVVPDDGMFHQVEAYYDQEFLRLYIDGEEKKAVASSTPLVSNNEPLYIGYDPPGTAERFEGVIDEVIIASGTNGDSDGDGVDDDIDACDDSILSATVDVLGCDSGVENRIFDDGCTTADLLSECDGSAWNDAVYVCCVAHLTNELKQEGVVDGWEKGAIQSCAARADLR